MASLDHIRDVAKRISAVAQKTSVVVVVSAMAGETDRLLKWVQTEFESPSPREVDALVSTGEEVSAALLAIALGACGTSAQSFRGSQIPMVTDHVFGEARIRYVVPHAINRSLAEGKVVVVAGFQGVTDSGDITTFGRGGSDLSAVALAIALDAQSCQVFKDVPGVLTADPSICSHARSIRRISFEEMLELASLGAKVLQTRSVQLARRYLMPIWVGYTFGEDQGTHVVAEEDIMENTLVTGVTCARDDGKLTVRNLPNQINLMSQVFSDLAQKEIIVDMIVQSQNGHGGIDLTLSLPRAVLNEAVVVVKGIAQNMPEVIFDCMDRVAKVSVVGLGMKTRSGVAARVFSALSREGIAILATSTSEIKISCLVEDKYAELAIRALHDEFNLGKEPH